MAPTLHLRPRRIFLNLENHPLRYNRPDIATDALLRYQARARSAWHDALTLELAAQKAAKAKNPREKRKKGEVLNLALIDENLMRDCLDAAGRADADRVHSEVCSLSSF